ncbi:hypothetical protein [Glycomyces sp. MUSA5-2]|uniref:hypothetical protein n=1 Tax=Glycomyces sp. MUSA5-2 TaxID=2053002 RepID=UPI00300831E2
MRHTLRRAVVLPLLLALLGLHVRKGKRKFHRLSSTGQTSAQVDTRTRVLDARVSVQRVDPSNVEKQVEVTTDHNNNIPHKTDQELRQDAETLEGLLVDLYGPSAKKWFTVATAQDANGNLYYTTNGANAKTDAYLRMKAEEMGYNRVSGDDIRQDGKNHAEQQMLNALAERRKAEAAGHGDLEPYRSLPQDPVRFSPGKAPCDDNPNNKTKQDCRADSDADPGGSLVGW